MEEELEVEVLTEEEFKINKKELTRNLLQDAIVDMIISGDKTVRDLFKHRDLTFIVTDKEEPEHMSFKYHDDRIFVQIPSTACDIEDLDFRHIIEKTEMATSQFIRKAVREKSDITGDVIEEQVVDKDIPTLKIKDFTYKADKKEEEEEEKDSGCDNGCGVSETGAVELNVSDFDKDQKYQFEDTEFSLDEQSQKDVEATRFRADTPLHKDMSHINAMANKLIKSFKGYMGKEARINPTKRMKNRAICSDYAEKIYITKKAKGGKKLDNINFLIDMSGSMGGEPVKNMVEILLVFNRIAQQGFLTGTIFYSESSHRCKITLPTQDKVINEIYRVGGSEGLADTIKHYMDVIKDSNIMFCITDGCITDTPIDKNLYAKYKFKTVGVYVNKDAKDLTEYSGSLNRWFDMSLVRRTTPELIDKLVALGLRSR